MTTEQSERLTDDQREEALRYTIRQQDESLVEMTAHPRMRLFVEWVRRCENSGILEERALKSLGGE